MARHPQPRRITLGGHEAVALTVEEYEQLMASRRQIGGQSARVRVLGQQVKRTEQLLQDLETLVAAPPARCREQAGTACAGDAVTRTDTDTGCLRCAIAALLRRHRDTAS
ncbi:hypothetical protein [Streptomyces sp. NBC_01092]|uniref:hypothetical protein n=1 Tax=Streptomyces sp. NBC_01092 TaxID=2903748 RepID=UPI00386406B6|nr:hypothetical protein OG254_39685 [Streptomyces sp. NBC_01092]